MKTVLLCTTLALCLSTVFTSEETAVKPETAEKTLNVDDLSTEELIATLQKRKDDIEKKNRELEEVTKLKQKLNTLQAEHEAKKKQQEKLRKEALERQEQLLKRKAELEEKIRQQKLRAMEILERAMQQKSQFAHSIEGFKHNFDMIMQMVETKGIKSDKTFLAEYLEQRQASQQQTEGKKVLEE